MKSTFSRIISMAMVVLMLAGAVFTIAACEPETPTNYYDNETDKLVFSTQEVDKVFNPFFSTSATDSNVVGMTQIGMLTNDANGNPVCGDDEATVARDYQIVTNDLPKDDGQQTTYYFVLKNNVLFSNGSPLTIKDVLFNLYVYLDPVYTGSSTIYSTEIVGLQEYRTQTADSHEQDAFEEKYRIAARARIDSLIEAAADILKTHDDEFITTDKMELYLEEEWSAIAAYQHVVEDFRKAQELFLQELNDDYSISIDSYEDQLFTDKNGNVHRNLLTSDVEMFLLNEGFITWDKNGNNGEGELLYTLGKETVDQWKQLDADAAREVAIQTVYDAKMPNDIEEILYYWQTANTLFDYIVAAEMEADKPDGALLYPNISGIKFANRTEAVEVNGVRYEAPQYKTVTDDNGKQWQQVVDGYNEVLSITIKNVDPKAIWNFSFGVAPMYYYSDEQHIAAFDYETNFGVEYKSQTFMDEVVKKNIGVPVGAGPYAASKASGGIDASQITAGDFYDKGVIYFERNPHYVAGPAKIKYLRFQVVPTNGMLNSLYTGQVDFAEPNAKQETEQELKGKASEGIGYNSIKTLGYGYIGINAGKIPSVYVRRAIMYAIDTSMTVTGWYTSPTFEAGTEFDAATANADVTIYGKWEESDPYAILATGSYAWTAADGVWSSGNAGVSGSTSTLTVMVYGDIVLTFTYGASGEGGSWDYLYISLNDTRIEDKICTKSSTIAFTTTSLRLTNGDVLTFTYRKDSGGNNYLDMAQVKDFSCQVLSQITLTYNFNVEGVADVVETYTQTDVVEQLYAVTESVNGKQFAGWYTSAQCADGEEFVAGTQLTESTTLYAKWVDPVVLTIVYGNGLDNATVTLLPGSILNLDEHIPSYTNGQVFDGWYSASTCAEGEEFVAQSISQNTTIWCKWVESDPISVVNSGSYDWTYADGIWSSTNAGHNSSKCVMTITALEGTTITFSYRASSENASRWDYFYYKVNGGAEQGATGGSGSLESKEWISASVTLSAGDVLELFYVKDSSSAGGDDMAQIKDLASNGQPIVSAE